MSITLETQETADLPSDATTVRRLDVAAAPRSHTAETPQSHTAEAPGPDTLIAQQSATAIAPVNVRGGNADPPVAIAGALTGTLIGFKEEGRVPLVLFPGQRGSAAVNAASTIDVHGCHIGHQVVLVFERGEADKPIIVGLVRGQQPWPLEQTPGQVEVDADGARLIVTAKEQLVLRCGSASITLTKAGKVLIQGEYVSSTSSGVMRIKGGSVQLN
jgi:Domain of unknown function (DUF6484)